MALNTVGFKVGMSWSQTESNSPFGSKSQGPDSITLEPSLNLNVVTQAYAVNFTLAAAGSQTLDLRSFTNLLGTTVAGANATLMTVRAVLTNTSNTGGQIRIAPGATNGLQWFFTANSNITLNVGSYGAAVGLCDGSPITVNNTSRNITFSNPGSNSVTVRVGFGVGA